VMDDQNAQQIAISGADFEFPLLTPRLSLSATSGLVACLDEH
jgi:hypothetical protein